MGASSLTNLAIMKEIDADLRLSVISSRALMSEAREAMAEADRILAGDTSRMNGYKRPTSNSATEIPKPATKG